MPTATWLSSHNNSIDEIFNTSTFPQIVAGILVSGGSKAGKRRALFSFDLNADPDAGARPQPGAQISSASLLLNVNQLDGIGAPASHIARITRDDWDGTSSWNNYHAVTTDIRPWTTPGGDYDAGTAIPFTGPSALGPFTVAGILPLVQEGIDNHAGQVELLIKIDGETGSFTTEYWCDASGPTRAALQLTYAAGDTVDERDRLSFAGVRPAFATRPAAAHQISRPARPARR
jgi:hypothetical protein